MNTPTTLNNGLPTKLGLGQFIDKYKGLKEIYHGGLDAGYRAYFSRFPEQSFSIIIFTNSRDIPAYSLASKVMDLYLKNDFKNSPNKETALINKKENVTKKDSIKYSVLELKEFSGKYYSPELQTAYYITSKENYLEIKHLRIGTLKIHPLKKDLFQDDGEWDFSNFHFIRNDSNKIIEMRFSGGGRIHNLKFIKQK
jgi:hypothetical protein